MSFSNGLRADPARMGVLGQGSPESAVLQQQTCLRCGNTWWPRRPTKPLRCPRCKSPYWARPRQVKRALSPVSASARPAALTDSLRREVAKALGIGTRQSNGSEDRSLTKALEVLKAMKAAGRTWNEMAELVEREFGTTLDKEQLKALVR